MRERRTEKISVRVTPSFKKRLLALHDGGGSVSEYIETVLERHVEAREGTPPARVISPSRALAVFTGQDFKPAKRGRK